MARAARQSADAAETREEPDRLPGAPHPRETTRSFGHDAAEATFLKAWADDRLHHAWLLSGPEGIGKATLAYRMARTRLAVAPGGGLMAEAQPESLDHGHDTALAARIRAEGEARLRVVRRTPNPQTGRMRTTISVDDVRRVKAFLQQTAADGDWRVVIVDPADEMNPNAANALLKMLEEPPARVLFLLVSHRPGALLPTIRSRCRMLAIPPLGPDDLAAALSGTGAGIAARDRDAIAALAGGSVRRALQLVADDGIALYGDLIDLFGPRGIDRPRMVALSRRCAGTPSAPAPAYLMAGLLIPLLCARAARHGAAGSTPLAASGAETALLDRIAPDIAAGRVWAEMAGTVVAELAHARAVNLDPAQAILDTCLKLDAALGRLPGAARAR